MAKQKNGRGSGKKNDLRALYARAHREFTAADLQRYTVEEAGIPAARILAEMEAIHQQESRKRKKT